MGINTVNLSKGEKINLSKTKVNLSKQGYGSSSLNTVKVGLGWEPVKKGGYSGGGGFFSRLFGGGTYETAADIDLDAWVLLAGDYKNEIVYYGSLVYAYAGRAIVQHLGDNLTGEGAIMSDKEQIIIDLKNMPDQFKKVVVAVTIYKGTLRGQSLDMVDGRFIHIDDEQGNELCRFTDANETGSMSGAQTLIAGAFTRDANNDWEFEALGIRTMDKSIADAITNMHDNIGRY